MRTGLCKTYRFDRTRVERAITTPAPELKDLDKYRPDTGWEILIPTLLEFAEKKDYSCLSKLPKKEQDHYREQVKYLLTIILTSFPPVMNLIPDDLRERDAEGEVDLDELASFCKTIFD